MRDRGKCISVIVPIFQVRDYLEKCIKSILSQTYDCLQIILVDDGSFDGSAEICDEYAKLDNRIEVYHKKNEGLVSARKFGLDRAKGEYIAFVDGDDYIDSNMYYELVNVISATGADFVNSGYYVIYPNQSNEYVKAPEFCFDIEDDAENRELLKKYFFYARENNFISPSIWSKLFRQEFIKEAYSIVPNEQGYGEDLICLFYSLIKCKKIVSIAKGFYNYVLRQGSLSNIEQEKYFQNELMLYSTLLNINELLDNPGGGREFFRWIREKVKDLMIATSESAMQSGMIHYYINDIAKIEGKKVVIYGAGAVGKGYLLQLALDNKCNIVGVIDKNAYEKNWQSFEVYSPNEINKINYDFIVIALKDKDTAMNIRDKLVKKHIEPSKIVWYEPCI